MKWLIATLVGAAAIFVILDTGLAIRCYECNSYFQQDCGDWFNNKTFNLEKCDVKETMCRKIVQEVYYDDHWDVRYIRQCAKSGEVGKREGRECEDRPGTKKVKVKYCQCNNQDGCNGAESVNFPKMLLILPALTTIGLVFRKL